MTLLPDLSTLAWAALAVSAVLVGFSKTALPGINTLAVAIFAAVLPAKPSTGALLLLLIVGDMFALWTYRKHAHWPTLVRMLPAVLVGLALGAVFLAFAGDSLVRRVIGVMLLMLMALTLWQRHRDAAPRDGDAAQVASVSKGARSPRARRRTVGAATEVTAVEAVEPLARSWSSSMRASRTITRGSYCRGSSLRQSMSENSGPRVSFRSSVAPVA